MSVPVNQNQSVSLILLGGLFWYLAALSLRYMAPYGIYEGQGQILMYILIIPATVPFVWLTKKIARLADNQVAIGMAVVTGTAIVLDGIALAWYPGLYATGWEEAAGAGATILWGGGVALFLGMIMNRE